MKVLERFAGKEKDGVRGVRPEVPCVTVARSTDLRWDGCRAG